MVTVPRSGDLAGPEITVTPNQARAARAAACRPAVGIQRIAIFPSSLPGEPPYTSVFLAQAFPPPVPLPIPSSLALLQLFPRKAETKDASQGDPCEGSLFLGLVSSPHGAMWVMPGGCSPPGVGRGDGDRSQGRQQPSDTPGYLEKNIPCQGLTGRE